MDVLIRITNLCDNNFSGYQAYFECETTWYNNEDNTYLGEPGPEIIVKVFESQKSARDSTQCHFHVNKNNGKTVTSNCPWKKNNKKTLARNNGGEGIILKMEEVCKGQQNKAGDGPFGSKMLIGSSKETFVKEFTARVRVDLTAADFKFVKKA